jgi:outer membrane protein assembly factor BamB
MQSRRFTSAGCRNKPDAARRHGAGEGRLDGRSEGRGAGRPKPAPPGGACPGRGIPLKRDPTIIVVLVVLTFTARLLAEDWPAFRGPTGQGHSSERNLPLEWNESRHVIWKAPIPGRGWSSPIVAGGRVWLTTAVTDRGASLRLLGFDAATGRELVNVEAIHLPSARLLNEKNSLASPTPIVDGDRVYVHFGAQGTAALTTTGEVVWKARFPYESQHGNGGSPILYGDLLILNCDGADTAFVVALDKRTGKVRWKTPRRQPWDQAYSTPLVINVGGRDQIVSVGAYRAAAYDPENGRELWRVSYDDGFSNVPRPVFGHGLVYIATGFQQPFLLAVRADGAGDVTRTHIAWTLSRAAPLTPSPLLVGDDLYIVNDNGIASAARSPRRRCSPTAAFTSPARTARRRWWRPGHSSKSWRSIGSTSPRSHHSQSQADRSSSAASLTCIESQRSRRTACCSGSSNPAKSRIPHQHGG